MIENVNDLTLNRKTYFETMFVFSFFTIDVTLESLITLGLNTTGKVMER